MNQRTKDYTFDLDRFSSFEGKTGPYLLYTAVRARSILRKAAEQSLLPSDILPPAAEAERTLMLLIAQLNDALQQTYDTRMPNHLAEYVYNLANEFNRFYNSCHILREENAAQHGVLAGRRRSLTLLKNHGNDAAPAGHRHPGTDVEGARHGEKDEPAKSAYAAAGVDLAAGNQATKLMKTAVHSTFGPEVLSGVGSVLAVYLT